MAWVPASYVRNGIAGVFTDRLSRICRAQSALWTLEVDKHDGLKGERFSVTNVGTVAPLLDGADGEVCESGVAFDEARAGNVAVLVDNSFEDERALDFGRTHTSRISGLHGVHQPFFRTFGRENDRGLLAGKFGIR